jgi:DNA-binding NtrC family response regulator
VATVPTQRRPRPPLAPARKRVLRIAFSPDLQAVGRVLPLSEESCTVGREVQGAGCVADGLMSRAHARISKQGARWLLEDLGSRNGTFVDGQRLDIPADLSANRVILIGATLLVVDEEPAPDLLPVGEEEEEEERIDEIGGISFATERLRRSLVTVARAPGNVLLLGPTGAGKDVAANAIHRLAQGSGRPFVPVNCAAITPELAESALFGHTKGAFTGAEGSNDGFFVEADGGTLFLDEIGELPPAIQAKLLRVLEDGMVRPIAGDPKQVNVRIIAATLRDLEGTGFRGDLHARLADWTLHLPSLAERRADVLPLFQRFLPRAELSVEAAEAMLLWSWPHNVRGLRKLAARLMTTKGERTSVDASMLPEEMTAFLRTRGAEIDDSLTDDHLDADAIRAGEPASGEVPTAERLRQELVRCRGNVSQVARENGWYKNSVYRWLKRYGINPNAFK